MAPPIAMEFRCDRCGTRYSTTQAIGGSRAYQYRCRVCQHTISVRGPAGDPGGGRAPGAPGRDVRTSARLPSIGTARRFDKPPPLPRAAVSATSAILPPAPAHKGGYLQVSDDDLLTPTGIHIDPFSASVDIGAATTPVPVRKPPAPQPRRSSAPSVSAPRVRSSFRSADAANRSARAEHASSSSFSRPASARQLGGVMGAPGEASARPVAVLSRGQRLLVSVAVFAAVTGLAVAVGIGVAARATERRGPGVAAAPALVPAALRGPMAPEPGAGSMAPAPDPQGASLAPPPRREADPWSSRSADGPERSRRAGVSEVSQAGRASLARPAREESRAGREPSRPVVRGLRVASAAPLEASRPRERRREAILAAPRSGSARDRDQVASAVTVPAGRSEEPVVARAGYHLPVPAVPGCVEQSTRLPASASRRPPRSVILRFAVDRRGGADLIQLQPGPDRPVGDEVEPGVAQALRTAVRGCRFTPGTDERGQAVRMWTAMKVKFAE